MQFEILDDRFVALMPFLHGEHGIAVAITAIYWKLGIQQVFARRFFCFAEHFLQRERVALQYRLRIVQALQAGSEQFVEDFVACQFTKTFRFRGIRRVSCKNIGKAGRGQAIRDFLTVVERVVDVRLDFGPQLCPRAAAESCVVFSISSNFLKGGSEVVFGRTRCSRSTETL